MRGIPGITSPQEVNHSSADTVDTKGGAGHRLMHLEEELKSGGAVVEDRISSTSRIGDGKTKSTISGVTPVSGNPSKTDISATDPSSVLNRTAPVA